MTMLHNLVLISKQFLLKRIKEQCGGRVRQEEVFEEVQIWKMRVIGLDDLNMRDKIIYGDLHYLMRK